MIIHFYLFTLYLLIMLFAYLFIKLYFCRCDFIFRIVNLNQFQAL